MKIRQLKRRLVFKENGVEYSLIGYALLDEIDRCIIIVYGEKRMKLLSSYI